MFRMSTIAVFATTCEAVAISPGPYQSRILPPRFLERGPREDYPRPPNAHIFRRPCAHRAPSKFREDDSIIGLRATQKCPVKEGLRAASRCLGS